MDDDVTTRRANRSTATTMPRPLHKCITRRVDGSAFYHAVWQLYIMNLDILKPSECNGLKTGVAEWDTEMKNWYTTSRGLYVIESRWRQNVTSDDERWAAVNHIRPERVFGMREHAAERLTSSIADVTGPPLLHRGRSVYTPELTDKCICDTASPQRYGVIFLRRYEYSLHVVVCHWCILVRRPSCLEVELTTMNICDRLLQSIFSGALWKRFYLGRYGVQRIRDILCNGLFKFTLLTHLLTDLPAYI